MLAWELPDDGSATDRQSDAYRQNSEGRFPNPLVNMALDVTKLDRALRVLREEGEDLFRVGLHVQASGYLHNRWAMEESGQAPVTKYLKEVRKNLRYIDQDLWDIETLVERIEWSRTLWVDDQLDVGRWARFTALDIDSFHVTIRSLFDYAAYLLCLISDKPGQMPLPRDACSALTGQASFQELRTWAAMPSSGKRASARFIAAIRDCEWFETVREVRNTIIHYGGGSFVIHEKPTVAFQATRGGDHSYILSIPEVMHNEHVVGFNLYAGLIYANLLDFLEEVGALIFDWLSVPLETVEERSRSQHPGMRLGREWITQVKARAAAPSGFESAPPPSP
jgi:hypothetical protein